MPCTEGCGSCCDPVTLSRVFVERAFMEHGPMQQQAEWIWANWEPLKPARNGDGVVLRCINYDVEARRCLAYGHRPPACSMYPFYGDDPTTTERTVGNACGYQAELGRTVLSIVEVRHGQDHAA